MLQGSYLPRGVGNRTLVQVGVTQAHFTNVHILDLLFTFSTKEVVGKRHSLEVL